ncbi:hypothetical protein M422DRAFT_260611 [Sphaerobolus stellatus SS14]|uniref:Zn(2)-C6 fungal-type domain-containing protein n=1 Tax=Sphaerobolus stellatus (strain SS14) TaxID=990650 RepID=A0A0C9VHE2_SPHS4|nr:hypothetical protein M422DRAFT_260611 [Sphaerobolus stellatus SS14]
MSDVFPSHILAWVHSSEVIQMEEIPAGDPHCMVQSFAADPLFPRLTPLLDYDDPYKQDEDHLKKVTRYWDTHNLERNQRACRYDELLSAEVEVAVQQHAAEQTAKEDIAGLFGNVKDKGKEVPRTPRRTPRKSMNVILSDSEEEKKNSNEAPPLCVECLRKKIPCVPQPGKKRTCMACYKHKIHCKFLDKTAWAVLEGSKKMAEAIRELAGMEKQGETFRLELKCYELQHFTFDLERTGKLDVAVADFRLLQMLNLKSQGLDVLEDLEEWFCMEHVDIEIRVWECMEAVMQHMAEIWERTGLDLLGGGPPDSPIPFGKRKAIEEEDNEEQEEEEGQEEEEKEKGRTGRRKRRKLYPAEENEE